MKKLNLILFIIAILVFGTLGFVRYKTYEPLDEAKNVIENKNIIDKGDYYIFEPSVKEIGNLIFYQGGLVKTEAYAPLCNLLSEKGIRVYLPKMPLNLAILKTNAMEKIINENETIDSWYISGHSLGGTSATMYFVNNSDKIDGIIYLGSYPDEKRDISDYDIRVLSILGSNDFVVDINTYNDAKRLLPKNTEYILIEGGNHGNFGYYGDQSGDGKAMISREEQHEITVNEIVDFIIKH